MIRYSLFFLICGGLFASSLITFYKFNKSPLKSVYEQNTFFSSTEPITFEYLNEDDIWKKVPKKQKKNFVYGANRYEIAMQMDKSWKFGIFDISEAALKTNADFINAYSSFKSGQLALYEKDKRYDVKAQGEYYRAHGTFIQKSFDYDKHTLFIQSRLLNGNEYLDIDLDGWIYDSISSGLSFDLDLTHDYFKQNMITRRKSSNFLFSGSGLSHDIAYRFNSNGFLFESGLKNVFGYIHWQNITYYNANANSQTVYLGEDGWYHYRPILRGYYAKIDSIHQKLTLHKYMLIEKTFDDLKVMLLGYRFGEYESSQISIRKMEYEFSYEPQFKNSELSYLGKNFSISISVNMINMDQAHTISASFTIFHY